MLGRRPQAAVKSRKLFCRHATRYLILVDAQEDPRQWCWVIQVLEALSPSSLCPPPPPVCWKEERCIRQHTGFVLIFLDCPIYPSAYLVDSIYEYFFYHCSVAQIIIPHLPPPVSPLSFVLPVSPSSYHTRFH